MNSYYRCTFILVLSFFIWTSSLQAEEKKSANEQAKEMSVSDSDIQTLPPRPSEKIIEGKLSFNSWINEGFLSLKNQITEAEIYKLRRICLRDGGLFEITTRDGRTFEDLDAMMNGLEIMQNENGPYIKTFTEIFFPLARETRQRVHHFLTNNTVYDGLEEKSKPDDMIAYWFQYGYLYAHDPNKLGPLFTKEFRKKIYANQYPTKGEEEEFDSIYDFLEELLEVSYELGIGHYENAAPPEKLIQNAFESAKKAIGPFVIQIDKQTRIASEDEEQGGLMWKFEDGAWRFNGSVMPATIEK